jgi:glycosyltransferase involved in cell wall biosynthesis
MSALVSIIIPSYNRAYLLNKTILSVQNQSYTNWEVILVDDFSTDATKELIFDMSKKDSRIKYFLNSRKGSNNARNLGIKKASGEWVVFLDSDDALMPNMLEVHLTQNNFSFLNYDISVGYTNVFRDDLEEELHSNISSENLLLDFLTKKVKWPINSAMIKKSFLDSNSINFHPNLLIGQDYCFFLELLNHDPVINYIREVLSINYHLSKESKGVKVSAGNSYLHKISRIKSRNIAFSIAFKKLTFSQMLVFLNYFINYQISMILNIISGLWKR